MSQLVHETIEEAFQKHWLVLSRENHHEMFLKPLMERHLNETLDHLVLSSPEFQSFFPFPVKIRALQDSKTGNLVWGFMQIGEDEALEWVKTVRADIFGKHFTPERWLKLSVPRISKNEVLVALLQTTRAIQQEGEDTLGALLRVGVHNHMEDRKLVALARLIDASGV
jgi:hypothetical protein